jgi:hypothetical protein
VNYPLLDAFLTMLWFFLWILWFILLFRVIADIFRDDSLSGWGKAGWLVFVIILPFLGVFVYLIARGRGMGERDARSAQRQEQEFRSYVRDAAKEPSAAGNGGASGASELEKLAGLRNHGDITEEEYQRAKAKVLAS